MSTICNSNATGYEVKGVSSAPYEKKGFFSFLKK